MVEQKFKIGDRVKIVDFTGTIMGVKSENSSIKYHIKIDNGRAYIWILQSALERMVLDVDNFIKQTMTVGTDKRTGEIIIRISNPKPTIEKPSVKGMIVCDVTNKSNKSKITAEQRTVLEGLYLLGYRYLACDENGCLYTYSTRPHRNMSDTSWDSYGAAMRVNMINDVIINLCSWKDEEPTSIEWLLGKKDKNE